MPLRQSTLGFRPSLQIPTAFHIMPNSNMDCSRTTTMHSFQISPYTEYHHPGILWTRTGNHITLTKTSTRHNRADHILKGRMPTRLTYHFGKSWLHQCGTRARKNTLSSFSNHL
ncbi:unnamed protein product [Chondrus crispus]|uniref:Uncharacterized protein n=1 Tax=Chondrus crispus TaxID=2769 RepID=R7QE95_CHOCR|nr:unnamed protein product [Chondrus crispus]CDF36073.1 unnamed protein product [Chondrus crispus]|eukprot:XP_005715892.1 unnamed protein product [Chondrus crispus]